MWACAGAPTSTDASARQDLPAQVLIHALRTLVLEPDVGARLPGIDARPPRHLDLPAVELLEAALMDFPGTAVLLGHDRALRERVAGRTLRLEARRLREVVALPGHGRGLMPGTGPDG